MLTGEAFNALLKTLEEPPKHCIFILATTEPEKIPPTILSRVQRFDFRRIPIKDIVKKLKEIAENEGVEASEGALYLIAEEAGGALRDAETLFEKIMLSLNPHKVINEEYVEENVPRYAMESFVNLIGNKTKVMIVTRGLHEYEVERKEKETSLKITLLRAVGYLSRGDLTTRKGHAGPYFSTPEAQCLGKYNFDYSFVILNTNKEKEMYEKSREYLLCPIAMVLPYKVEEWKFLEIPDGLFLTALKISEDGEDLIVRFVNLGNEEIYTLRSAIFKEAYITDMKEENKEFLGGKGEWHLSFKKGEVKTIRLVLSSERR